MNLLFRSIRTNAFILSMILWVGCTVTETGNPTAVSIDTDSIYIQKAEAGVKIVGEKRAVTPGGSRLRIVNLDTVSEPLDIPVEDDGSFRVVLQGALDDVYRLRALYGEERSDPVNISGEPIQDPERTAFPSIGCRPWEK